MSQAKTSTRRDEAGTFGARRILCVHDGSTMTKIEGEQPVFRPDLDTYYCAACGWVTNFLKRE